MRGTWSEMSFPSHPYVNVIFTPIVRHVRVSIVISMNYERASCGSLIRVFYARHGIVLLSYFRSLTFQLVWLDSERGGQGVFAKHAFLTPIYRFKQPDGIPPPTKMLYAIRTHNFHCNCSFFGPPSDWLDGFNRLWEAWCPLKLILAYRARLFRFSHESQV